MVCQELKRFISRSTKTLAALTEIVLVKLRNAQISCGMEPKTVTLTEMDLLVTIGKRKFVHLNRNGVQLITITLEEPNSLHTLNSSAQVLKNSQQLLPPSPPSLLQ